MADPAVFEPPVRLDVDNGTFDIKRTADRVMTTIHCI